MKKRLSLLDVAPLRNVDTVKELTDILVADAADLLDVGGGLGDVLDGVAAEDKLVLDVLGGLDVNTLTESDAADELLAEEVPAHSISVSPFPCLSSIFPRSSWCRVPDLNNPEASVVVLVKVDVDGEMGVDVTHLVLEALGDTDDHVVDERTDGTESGDVLAGTVVHLDLDGGLIGLLEGDGQVTEILLKDTTGTLDSDLTGLDVDLDCTAVLLVFFSLVVAHFLRPIVPPIRSFRYPRSFAVGCRIEFMAGSGGFWGTTHLPQGPSGLPRSECTSFWRRGAVG